MSQSLPYDEITFDKNVKLEDRFKTTGDFDAGFFNQVDLKNPDQIKQKTNKIIFVLVIYLVLMIDLIIFLNKMKPNSYTKKVKFWLDW